MINFLAVCYYVSPNQRWEIIEAFERLTLQLDKGYWREKHTSHNDSHQGNPEQIVKDFL